MAALWRDDRDAFGKANKRVCELEIELLKMQEAGRNTIKRAETAEAAIERVRAICDAVNYKVPDDPDSYGPYPEGRCDLAAEVLATLDEPEATG